MRVLLLIALVVPALVFGLNTYAQDDVTSGKRPLDLPTGVGSSDEDDEDAPESINFYGGEMEGDGFFFAFPAFAFCGVMDAFYAITDEVKEAISVLSSKSVFALISYNGAYEVWRPKAVRATGANKVAAIGWIDSLTTTEQSAIVEPGLELLRICNSTHRAQKKQILFVGGKRPTDSAGAVETLTGANYKRVPIHTVYVSTVYSGHADFWTDLATANGGTFQEIQ